LQSRTVDSRTERLVRAAAEIAASGDTIFDAIDEFLDGLDAAGRQAEVDRVWLEAPIAHEEAQGAYPDLGDEFDVLQGDVIRTEAAYVLGRREPGPYVVASATCDTVVRPKPRRGSILLLPVVPRTLDDFPGGTADAKGRDAAATLARLMTFRGTRALYLPRLAGDTSEVLFNMISFQQLAVLDSAAIPTVQRVASMSLVGWRAFNILVRIVIGRAGDEEAGFRLAVSELRAAA
jgi:hypothetical protein